MAGENVKVSVRVRPPAEGSESPSCAAVQQGDRSYVSTSDPTSGEKRRFAFDAVFSENDSNSRLYSVVASELLHASLSGVNVTLLAYGQTGSGKTYTMFGSSTSLGLVPMLLKELTSRLGANGTAHMSMLEVYNENPRDLLCGDPPSDDTSNKQIALNNYHPQQQQHGLGLAPNDSPAAAFSLQQNHQQQQRLLKVREDPVDGPYAEGLTWHSVPDWRTTSTLLERGNAAKAIGANNVHAKSSRSHTLVQLKIRVPDRDAATGAQRIVTSQINLVDLAGSERVPAAGSRYPQTAIEGKHINKSLSALGDCVRALADKRRENHVPFRNSVLTWLLKNSLAGNARTAVIANVSPDGADYTHTLGSIRFVDRMQRIETAAVVNEERKPLFERGANNQSASNAPAWDRRDAARGQQTEKYHGVGGKWVRGKGFVKAAVPAANKGSQEDADFAHAEKRQRVSSEETHAVQKLPESPMPPQPDHRQRPKSRDGWVEEGERGRVLGDHGEEMRQHKLRSSTESGVQYLRRLEEDILRSISTTSLPIVKEPASEQFKLLGPELPQQRQNNNHQQGLRGAMHQKRRPEDRVTPQHQLQHAQAKIKPQLVKGL